ncbi:uncharacterized protein RBU57_003380 isoform 1-T1 [Macrochelys suwanniensis]
MVKPEIERSGRKEPRETPTEQTGIPRHRICGLEPGVKGSPGRRKLVSKGDERGKRLHDSKKKPCVGGVILDSIEDSDLSSKNTLRTGQPKFCDTKNHNGNLPENRWQNTQPPFLFLQLCDHNCEYKAPAPSWMQ